MRLPLCLLFALSTMSTSHVVAQTTVPGGLIASQIWNAAGSPYLVTGDINVAYLIIQPGVRVELDAGVGIEVTGILDAAGTELAPVVFTASDPTMRWKHIRFQNTQPGSRLVHCRIELASVSALEILDSQFPIEDCVLHDNTRSGSGGAISATITNGLDLVLTRCTLSDNSATGNGGAVHATFTNGGTLRVLSSVVSGNVSNPANSAANRYGGGLWVSGDTEIRSTDIRGNDVRSCAPNSSTRSSHGGGLYAAGAGVHEWENVTFSENAAIGIDCGSFNTYRGYGGGAFVNDGTVSAKNCIFAANTLSGNARVAGGLYVNIAQVDLVNCTLTTNDLHAVHNAGGTVSLRNSIVYFNNGGSTSSSPSQLGGTMTVEFCDVQGGYTGTGNISVNPILTNSAGTTAGDLAIVFPSQCIDAGDPAGAYDDVCFPPSLDTSTNDMGITGGALACNWLLPSPFTPVYPGSGEDLVLRTGVNGPITTTPDIKNAAAGDQLFVNLDSPFGTFTLAPALIGFQVFMAPNAPGSPSGLPELHLNPGVTPGPGVLYDGLIGGFGTPFLPVGGVVVTVVVPAGLSGFSTILQGLAIDPAAANRIFAATDAHEIVF